jgi:uncharacterized spore protein YtfJ
MSSLNRLFDTIENAREAAHWRAAFGEAQQVDDTTIIPVAQVAYGFGLGFGSGPAQPGAEGEPAPEAEGGGAGGGVRAKPMGAIVVTPECVYFQETADTSKIALFGIGLTALAIYQVAKTLRAIAGKD